MTTYKLTYFGVKGLGESIRFLFSYAGVEFIDERLDLETWAKVKPTTPFGQVPVLEVDGKKVAQSIAICRYLAKQFGIAGKDDWEALEIDAAVDTLLDVQAKCGAIYYEKDPVAKVEKRKIAQETAKIYFAKLDEQVKRNGGYLVGGKLTWADIVFAALVDLMNYRTEIDVIENAENMKALKEKVLAQPGIKAWIAKRPKSDF